MSKTRGQREGGEGEEGREGFVINGDALWAQEKEENGDKFDAGNDKMGTFLDRMQLLLGSAERERVTSTGMFYARCGWLSTCGLAHACFDAAAAKRLKAEYSVVHKPCSLRIMEKKQETWEMQCNGRSAGILGGLSYAARSRDQARIHKPGFLSLLFLLPASTYLSYLIIPSN